VALLQPRADLIHRHAFAALDLSPRFLKLVMENLPAIDPLDDLPPQLLLGGIGQSRRLIHPCLQHVVHAPAPCPPV
jgi:hypothetical protein